MKVNPIVNAIRESFYQQARETEVAVFSMLLTKSISPKGLSGSLTIESIARKIHEASMRNVGVNFMEGELVFQDNYEVHSVTGSRDEDGNPEVSINMYEISTGETHSVRICEFPQLDWLLQVIEAVNNKCDLTLNLDENDN